MELREFSSLSLALERHTVSITCRVVRGSIHRLGETKVEHLDGPIRPHFDVCWLEITVDDALLMRGLKGFCYLDRYGNRFVSRNRAATDDGREIGALDKFHHEDLSVAGVFETVDVSDVGDSVQPASSRISPGYALRPRS